MRLTLLFLLVLGGCEEEVIPSVADLSGTFVGLWNIEGCYGDMILHATEGGVTGTMRCAEGDWETWGNFREIAAEDDGAVRVSGAINRATPTGTVVETWRWVAWLQTDGDVIFGEGNADAREGSIYLEPE